MTELHVQASKTYTVTVGQQLLQNLGAYLPQNSNICIVSDQNVWAHYGELIQKSCRSSHFPVCYYILAPGESSKNWDHFLPLINFLAENHLSRKDCIVALGGGVVGDVAGFAAATYLRGIPYIQIPTSLLAMVDSSVGGKTGIDLPAGKNLCGAFYHPETVICDTEVLNTLPDAVFRDGCAEIIKYAVLFDPELFAHLESRGLDFDRETVIARCISHKCQCVQQDEFDHNQRMLLNLGHTFGHAIETCSNYTISHGSAVSIGLSILCRATKCVYTRRILGLLQKFGLPIATSLPINDLLEACLSDKKRSGEILNLIIPKAIGNCAIVPTPVQNLRILLEEGM